ncbi:hypothetical protein GIX10_11490 [Acinetobacter sp. YIM 103518]|uniref:Uncharacterized protein n=1 Tax=Acinetobacter faecalis TaxID=2665161 RepID=A0A6L6GGW4_9GAMM|nr:hypothetical protein [Acinetobacter faecalis]MTD12033.1 hypothetical protein [Acinetobacter faecalis]
MLPKFCLSFMLCAYATTTWSSDLRIGDPSTTTGELSLSGWIRGNIQDKDYSDQNEHRLKFDALKINLNYQSDKLFGNLHYRCYQNDKICDFSGIVDANIGYKINDDHHILAGIQPIPFGPNVGWSSSWWGGLMITAGLEDVHNTGLTLSSKLTPSTHLDFGYFLGDAGNFVGKSQDSARYSANLVQPDQATDLDFSEKNMWFGRIKQNLNDSDHPLQWMIGASYWYSDLESLNKKQGNRQSWSAFSQVNYQNLNLTFTVGQNKLDIADRLNVDYVTMGSFDMSYRLANEADFYTLDAHYKLDDIYQGWSLSPYATYSHYAKKDQQNTDSARYIVGAALDKKPLGLALEYIVGKNDPFIDGQLDSLAKGSTNEWNRLINLLFFYHF